ncbi:MAG TPA: type II secretion system F family protein [Candidatus Thermoplasmatota archaeon]|nr:type II secretion system F family protein [Candidatus Thermoplasmatota archaeon]
MTFSRLEAVSYHVFGRRATRAMQRNVGLGHALQRARMPLRPEVHLAVAYMVAAVTAAAALVGIVAIAVLSVMGTLPIAWKFFILLVPAAVVLGAGAYLITLVVPPARALGRARNINSKLPYSINYLSTMASAGATPEQLFATLAEQPLYGEVAVEAQWIARDMRILGLDIVTALQNGIDRSPSDKWKDFLQGAVTTLTSGADLKAFFAAKADQYIYENRQEQRKFLEGLGVLAESFVTVVVAAPLFLIVILSVMTSFGGSPTDALLIGYSLIFLVIPLSQAGFAWTIKVMTPEA